MKDLFSLNNKRILITGSTRGIGRLLAEGVAEQGAEVIINGTNQQKAQAVTDELNAKGYKAQAVAFDITDTQAVQQAVDHIEQHIGAIDVLINNAGIQRRHPFCEFPEQEYDEVIRVNQKSVFIVSQIVARYMVKRQQGKIINIGSMQSELGRDTITPYAASKGAVKMLTRGMCVELARYNIQVNGIAPGYFKTELTKPLVENKEFSDWLCKRTPAARWGNPEELIGAAVFLSSKASDFVNGHLLFVDGGMLAAV
ncbi:MULTISPECIES: gluconate 5-dehydrogenase [Lonepinella]|uniref:gluconate 5-dehydrogenase n=1 Tax=Lonepinella TaxID=53416 RepID=UPI0036DB38D9